MTAGPRQDVQVLQLPADTLHALAAGDLDEANRTAPVTLPPIFVTDGWIGTWRYRSAQVREDAAVGAWITGAVVDRRSGEVVGRAGFHGAPDGEGMVEVGYAVLPDLRRRGYARAVLEALLARAAHEPAVRVVRASVSPDNAPSLGLIGQYGFVRVGTQWDDEDGLEIVHEVPAGPAS